MVVGEVAVEVQAWRDDVELRPVKTVIDFVGGDLLCGRGDDEFGVYQGGILGCEPFLELVTSVGVGLEHAGVDQLPQLGLAERVAGLTERHVENRGEFGGDVSRIGIVSVDPIGEELFLFDRGDRVSHVFVEMGPEFFFREILLSPTPNSTDGKFLVHLLHGTGVDRIGGGIIDPPCEEIDMRDFRLLAELFGQLHHVNDLAAIVCIAADFQMAGAEESMETVQLYPHCYRGYLPHFRGPLSFFLSPAAVVAGCDPLFQALSGGIRKEMSKPFENAGGVTAIHA